MVETTVAKIVKPHYFSSWESAKAFTEAEQIPVFGTFVNAAAHVLPGANDDINMVKAGKIKKLAATYGRKSSAKKKASHRKTKKSRVRR